MSLMHRLCRFRQLWLFWIGGWEKANCAGWEPRWEYGWRELTPVTILRAITFYGWGLQVRLPTTIFVWSWRGDRGMFFSPDGTPGRATRWLRKPRWM